MKKVNSLPGLAMMLILALFTVSASFGQTEQKTTTQAKKPMTREEYITMLSNKIATMEKKFTSLKSAATAKKKDADADYKSMLSTAEGKLSALKTKVSSFKDTAEDKVEAFKKETHEAMKSIQQDYAKLHTEVYGEPQQKQQPKKTPQK